MSYQSGQLLPVGAMNRDFDGGQVFSYVTTDTIDQCEAAGYFNEANKILFTGDNILVWAADGFAIIQCARVDPDQVNIQPKDTRATPPVVYDDYLVPGLGLGLGASSPTLKVFRGNVQQLAFSGSGPMEQGFFTVHLLHGLKAGTDLTFHVHWAHIIAVPSGNVKWNIEYTVARGYEAGVFADPVSLSCVHTAGAQYAHHITDDDEMTISSGVEIEPDSLILGRVFRDSGDAQDTFANDAYLLEVDLHYQKSHRGTIERNRPFTSTGFGA